MDTATVRTAVRPHYSRHWVSAVRPYGERELGGRDARCELCPLTWCVACLCCQLVRWLAIVGLVEGVLELGFTLYALKPRLFFRRKAVVRVCCW